MLRAGRPARPGDEMVESKHPSTAVAKAVTDVAAQPDEYPKKFVTRLEASQKAFDELLCKLKILQPKDKAPKAEIKAFFPAFTGAQKEVNACLRLIQDDLDD